MSVYNTLSNPFKIFMRNDRNRSVEMITEARLIFIENVVFV